MNTKKKIYLLRREIKQGITRGATRGVIGDTNRENSQFFSTSQTKNARHKMPKGATRTITKGTIAKGTITKGAKSTKSQYFTHLEYAEGKKRTTPLLSLPFFLQSKNKYQNSENRLAFVYACLSIAVLWSPLLINKGDLLFSHYSKIITDKKEAVLAKVPSEEKIANDTLQTARQGQFSTKLGDNSPTQPQPASNAEKNWAVPSAEGKQAIDLKEIGEWTDDRRGNLDPNKRIIPETEDKRFYAFYHSKHTVSANESLWVIAKRYGVSIDAIISANGLKNFHALKLGQVLKIPQYSGVYHHLEKGETLANLSKKYGVSLDRILAYNHRTNLFYKETMNSRWEFTQSKNSNLVFIPGGKIDETQRRELFGTIFISPTEGYLTSTYGYRMHPIIQKRLFHTGIDIGGRLNSPVYAIANGRIKKTINNSTSKEGYGNLVIIKHRNGYESLYAHLEKVKVKKGQTVSRGQPIGTLGDTGLSTGPHLHLEIKKDGRYINPERFFKLKKNAYLLPNYTVTR